MRESGLLNHIYARSAGLAARFPQVVAGPGDDCAVIASPGGERLLLKVDQLIEGRHFVGPVSARADAPTPINLVARKALARPISDIAASGGTPWAALATAALPSNFDQHTADELFSAMAGWAEHWGCPLVGGDIAATEPDSAGRPAPVALTVTIVGVPHRSRGPVARSGARLGDAIYVTGQIGGSFDSGRHLTFEPRLAEARWLCATLGPDLHAMMDLSDGLGLDAARLARASRVNVELDAASIPLHAGVADWLKACGDGEDYELLLAVEPGRVLPPTCPWTGTPLTRIGVVQPQREGSPACVVRTPSGVVDLSEAGWEHREP